MSLWAEGLRCCVVILGMLIVFLGLLLVFSPA